MAMIFQEKSAKNQKILSSYFLLNTFRFMAGINVNKGTLCRQVTSNFKIRERSY